jgi:hypothetical protein
MTNSVEIGPFWGTVSLSGASPRQAFIREHGSFARMPSTGLTAHWSAGAGGRPECHWEPAAGAR